MTIDDNNPYSSPTDQNISIFNVQGSVGRFDLPWNVFAHSITVKYPSYFYASECARLEHEGYILLNDNSPYTNGMHYFYQRTGESKWVYPLDDETFSYSDSDLKLGDIRTLVVGETHPVLNELQGLKQIIVGDKDKILVRDTRDVVAEIKCRKLSILPTTYVCGTLALGETREFLGSLFR